MDNRASENAEWDEALLGLELGDLQGDGFDLALTGFDDDELNRLLAGLGDEDGDPRGRGRRSRDARGPGQPAGRSLAARERTGCSAATPPWRPTSSGCSAA